MRKKKKKKSLNRKGRKARSLKTALHRNEDGDGTGRKNHITKERGWNKGSTQKGGGWVGNAHVVEMLGGKEKTVFSVRKRRGNTPQKKNRHGERKRNKQGKEQSRARKSVGASVGSGLTCGFLNGREEAKPLAGLKEEIQKTQEGSGSKAKTSKEIWWNKRVFQETNSLRKTEQQRERSTRGQKVIKSVNS